MEWLSVLLSFLGKVLGWVLLYIILASIFLLALCVILYKLGKFNDYPSTKSDDEIQEEFMKEAARKKKEKEEMKRNKRKK